MSRNGNTFEFLLALVRSLASIIRVLVLCKHVSNVGSVLVLPGRLSMRNRVRFTFRQVCNVGLVILLVRSIRRPLLVSRRFSLIVCVLRLVWCGWLEAGRVLTDIRSTIPASTACLPFQVVLCPVLPWQVVIVLTKVRRTLVSLLTIDRLVCPTTL